jgi:uncharacterized protein (TIGR02246 family)
MNVEENVVGTQEIAQEILAMERAALDRWGNGDPDGFLEISAEDVDYFDPFQAGRVKSREELRQIYDGLRGLVKIAWSDIVNPQVRVCGDVAVLTFNFVSRTPGETESRWNTTEVYERRGGRWLIVHTHWSFTQPKLAP